MRLSLALLAFSTLLGCGGDSSAPSGLGGNSQNNTQTPKYMSLTPAFGSSVTVGGTTQFTAEVTDAIGNRMSVSVAWSSSNTSVAPVDQTGRVVAKAAGSSTITAAVTGTGISQSATVTVTAAVEAFTGTLYVSSNAAPFPGGPSSYEVQAVVPSTGAKTNLTLNSATDSNPIVSPDGNTILFFTDRFVRNGEWVAMRSNGTNVRRLYSACSWYDGFSLNFRHCAIPVGFLGDSRLMFWIVDEDKFNNLNPIRLLGTQDVNGSTTWLSVPSSVSTMFSIAPAGDVGAYTVSGAIYTQRLSGGGATQLTQPCTVFPSTCSSPVWAPDGHALYTAREGSVYEVPAAGGSMRLLFAATAGSLASLTPSPDGKQLAFMDGDKLRVVRLDGSGVTNLGDALGQLAWSPDSKSIAYAKSYYGNGIPDLLMAVNASGVGSRTVGDFGYIAGIAWGR